MGVKIEKTTISCGFLASVIGVEPTAFRLGVRRSLQNSVKNDDFLAILAVLSTILHPNWLISTVN